MTYAEYAYGIGQVLELELHIHAWELHGRCNSLRAVQFSMKSARSFEQLVRAVS